MTGYGSSDYRGEKVHLSVQIKSYNNRYLDLYINLPPYLTQIEPRIREYLSSRVNRGKVELSLGVMELEENIEVFLDQGRVKAYWSALEELKRITGLREKVRLSHLIRMEGILKTEPKREADTFWAMLVPVLGKAFQEFNHSRIVEGKRTEDDIRRLLGGIEGELGTIEARVPEIENRIQESLKQKFFELLGDGIDETRILSETALLLVKFDIHEEIVRIQAHLKAFSSALDGDGAIGKKLDFICQEIFREINTIGSKSTIREIDASAIAIKDGLEKIREQLRNVE